MRIAPPVDHIVVWCDSAVERERKRRERNPFGSDLVPVDEPITRIHLEWRAGAIDEASSWVRSRLAPGMVDPTKSQDSLTQGLTVMTVDVDPGEEIEQAAG